MIFKKPHTHRGFTLIELVVSVGIFAIITTLVSGAYLLMIGTARQAQDIATGVNGLSFALESMVRTIRTGTVYSCDSSPSCAGGNSFSVLARNGVTTIKYYLQNYALYKQSGVGTPIQITDPNSIKIDSLKFYLSGALPYASGLDRDQPHVIILISATVSSPGKPAQTFSVETSATMRVTDL